ncbi:hypothetical protein ACG873_31370 [Mesorhizobium sp. AaZ16]|uniref:hypothetical protein n=1 Tax=Mesorhizobium sp. AaZ16 TaxID=3402289 RepID=UPI00374E3264
MPQIGTSIRNQDGFFGNIGTLTLDASCSSRRPGQLASREGLCRLRRSEYRAE